MIPHDDGAAGLGTGLRLVLGSASPGRAASAAAATARSWPAASFSARKAA